MRGGRGGEGCGGPVLFLSIEFPKWGGGGGLVPSPPKPHTSLVEILKP